MKTVQKMFAGILLASMIITGQLSGQTVMGILPVNPPTSGTSVLTTQQWQAVSLQMQDHFALQLAGVGTIKKLSREHILLLLKEMPSPDPESLTAEAYKVISKKEQLQYLLKCSIESMQVADKNVICPIRVIILDSSNGKVFWEKPMKINKIVSNPLISEHLLLNEVFKPSVNELSKEIKMLKY